MTTYEFNVNSEKKVYRVIPPEARGSYMQRILESEAFEAGDDPEWGCQLRWPMDNDEVKAWAKEMAGLFQQILIDKVGKASAAKLIKKPNLKIPLRNGNNEDNEELEGWLFMNVRNKFRQPVIMGPHAKALPPELINDNTIYSGAWYRTKLIFKYYKHPKGGEGIGAYIEILMKTKDDERLDSVINIAAAEEEFSGFATTDAFEGAPSEESEKIEKPDEDEDFDFL